MVTSIILLTIFLQVIQFYKITLPYLSEELVDNSIHLMFMFNILRTLDMSTNVRWEFIDSITLISRFRFVSLLSVPCNEQISSEVILNLVIK